MKIRAAVVLFIVVCVIGVAAEPDAEKIRKAAEQGDPEAQFLLGRGICLGQGFPRDPKEGVKWFRKAAEQGSPIAQWAYGKCYHDGVGVSQDPKEAARWYQKAAEQGFAEACVDMGWMCDAKEARKWFQVAADQGNSRGQLCLGRCFTQGRDEEKDYVLAYMWLSLVRGEEGRDALDLRRDIEPLMTPAQIKKAQELAQNWKPSVQSHQKAK